MACDSTGHTKVLCKYATFQITIGKDFFFFFESCRLRAFLVHCAMFQVTVSTLSCFSIVAQDYGVEHQPQERLEDYFVA